MNQIYDFAKINKQYQIFTIQACIQYIKESKNYISIILTDIKTQKIELIVFKNEINAIKRFKLILNKWYIISNVETILNNKYKRTNHHFKLKFMMNLTKIKKAEALKMLKNNKIYILESKQKNESKQLSILNFVKTQ